MNFEELLNGLLGAGRVISIPASKLGITRDSTDAEVDAAVRKYLDDNGIAGVDGGKAIEPSLELARTASDFMTDLLGLPPMPDEAVKQIHNDAMADLAKLKAEKREPESLGDILGEALARRDRSKTATKAPRPKFDDLSTERKEEIAQNILRSNRKKNVDYGGKLHHEPFETNDNGVVLESLGLRVMHFQNGKGGMTIAYEDPAKNRINNPHTFRFSTAIVHPDDTFSRKIGTATAIRNFNKGNVATLPILGGLDIVQTLKSYFYYFDDKLSTEFDAGLEGYAQMYALTQGLAAGIKDATE